MTTQELIDYLNAEKTTKTAEISNLTMTVTGIDQAISQANLSIEQFEIQKTDTQAQISQINDDIETIDEIITILNAQTN